MQKIRLLQTHEGKNYTWNSTYKGMARKNDFTSENILLYNPQRDKALSTSKKEVRNNGIDS